MFNTLLLQLSLVQSQENNYVYRWVCVAATPFKYKLVRGAWRAFIRQFSSVQKHSRRVEGDIKTCAGSLVLSPFRSIQTQNEKRGCVLRFVAESVTKQVTQRVCFHPSQSRKPPRAFLCSLTGNRPTRSGRQRQQPFHLGSNVPSIACTTYLPTLTRFLNE